MDPLNFKNAEKVKAFLKKKNFLPSGIDIPVKPKLVVGKVWKTEDKKFNIFIQKKVNGGGKNDLKETEFKKLGLETLAKMTYHKVLPDDAEKAQKDAAEGELQAKVSNAQSLGNRGMFRRNDKVLKAGLKLMVKIQEGHKSLPGAGGGERGPYDQLLRQYQKYSEYAEHCHEAYDKDDVVQAKFKSKNVTPFSTTKVQANIAKLQSVLTSMDAGVDHQAEARDGETSAEQDKGAFDVRMQQMAHLWFNGDMDKAGKARQKYPAVLAVLWHDFENDPASFNKLLAGMAGNKIEKLCEIELQLR
jgi:hypothetical protein